MTVTAWSPVMAGAVKGMTRPLLRRMSVWVRVMPPGRTEVLPLASRLLPPSLMSALLPGQAGQLVSLARAGLQLPPVTGLPLASRTETVSRETGTTMLRVWSDSSAPIGRW